MPPKLPASHLRLALPTFKRPSISLSVRPFTTTFPRRAEGDTGALRHGGDRSADSWSRREKAAEDLYIRGREKAIMQLMREKIGKREAALAKDRVILSQMEDQYGRFAEGVEGEGMRG